MHVDEAVNSRPGLFGGTVTMSGMMSRHHHEREFSHATVTVSANSCLFIFNFLSTNFKRLNQSMVTFGSYCLDKV